MDYYPQILPVKFIFDVNAIVFPPKTTFRDYKCTMGCDKIDTSNWHLSEEFFNLIDLKHRQVKYLILNRVTGMDSSSLEKLRGLHALHTVHLRGSVTIDKAIGKLISSWSRIFELDISECKIESFGISAMLSNCSLLQNLICQKCSGLDDFGLIAISECVLRFRKLHRIDISKNADFTDEGVLSLFSAGITLLSEIRMTDCNKVTNLSFAGLRKKMRVLKHLDIQNLKLSPSAYEWISEGCFFLTFLNISRNCTVDDNGLILIGRKCRYLKHFDVSFCSNISDEGIIGFSEEFQGKLEYIDLSSSMAVGDASAIALSKISSNFQTLHLNSLSQISEKAMVKLYASSHALQSFEMCTDIKNSSTQRRSIIPHISDHVVLAAQNKLTLLTNLRLSGAYLMSDAGLCHIIRHNRLLTILDISYCNSITNQVLLCLGEFSQNLKQLSISGSGNISDSGILALCRGCLYLHKLECHGVKKLTDVGVTAISSLGCALRSLNIGSCDDVTDAGIENIALRCTNMRYLDISSLDTVTSKSILAITRNCLEIEFLNCQGCDILNIEFQKYCAFLPYSQASLSKNKIIRRPDAIVAFNQFVMKTRKHTAKAITLQKNIRCFVEFRKYKKLLKARERAAVTIQRVFRGTNGRKVAKDIEEYNKQLKFCVINLQRAMRRIFAIKYAKSKLAVHKKSNKAAIIVQRVYRGHKCRTRLKRRFRNQTTMRSIFFYLTQKLLILRSVRATRQKIIKVQSQLRRYMQCRKYTKTINSFSLFQNIVRVRLAVCRVTSYIVNELVETNMLMERAAFSIQKLFLAKRHNENIITFVKYCALHYRNEEDKKEWQALVREESATKIQAKVRGNRCRRIQRQIKHANVVGYSSARRIQTAYRRHYCQLKYKPFRLHKKKVSAMWKLLFRRNLDRYYGFYASKIQKKIKLNQYITARKAAASLLQRVYRGHQGKKIGATLRLIYRHSKIKIIQKVWRRYALAKFNQYMFARRHIAARRIQIVARSYLNTVAKRRIYAAVKAKEYEKQIEQKEMFLKEKRLKVVNKIKENARQRAATKIQNQWRKYHGIKKRKHDAALNRLNINAEVTNKKSLFETGRDKLKSMIRIPNPVNAAIEFARVLDRTFNEDTNVDKAEQPKFLKSILSYQTQSIQQSGITEIAMTYGEAEATAFQQRQNFLKSTKRRYYTMLDGDLSGYLDLWVKLWIQTGKGSECICEIKVKEKPANCSAASLRNRSARLRIEGVNVTWNEKVHIEVHGICSLKQRKSGFAVSELRICHTSKEAVKAKKAGLKIVSDLMIYSFPTSLWAKIKAEPPKGEVFNFKHIETYDWFDERMRNCCEKFYLSDIDIFSFRSVFDSILNGSFSFEIMVEDILEFMKIPRTTIFSWILKAIQPRNELALSFSEYVHLVSYWIMFGFDEKVRFIFGATCERSTNTLSRASFDQTIEYLTEGFTGQKNLIRYQRAFDNYKNVVLDLMFISDFHHFVETNPRVFWSVNEIQEKFMKHNLGRHYWELKIQKYMKVRENLGFKKV